MLCRLLPEWSKSGRNLPPSLASSASSPILGQAGGHEWTEEQRWRVIILWKYEGKSIHSIARELKIDRSNVKRLIEKYQNTRTVERQQGQGRKRKLPRKVARQLKKKAKPASPRRNSFENTISSMRSTGTRSVKPL